MHVLLERLQVALNEKRVSDATEVLAEMESSVLQDPVLIKEITNPSTYKMFQDTLVNDFGINPRALMLKNRVPSRPRRAFLFIKVLQNGVNRIE